MPRFFSILSGLFLLVLLASLSLAGIPKMINYQGMLTDDTGTPLTGSYNLTFTIWTDTTGGSSLWTETQNGVQVQNGIFNLILGRLTALNLPFDQQYWLEVQVGAETMPRLRFTSVGYAYRASVADTAYTIIPGAGSHWTVTDSVLYTNKKWGIARGGAGNVLFGDSAHTMVNLGVACTTGTSGLNNAYCTVSGGKINTASNLYATVGGGSNNTASGYAATVVGGYINTASGYSATVGGGLLNNAGGYYSFAAGHGANANHTGTFVWADNSTDAWFASTDENQFLIRAAGGVGIGTTSPNAALTVNGEISIQPSGINRYHLGYYNGGLNFAQTGVADYRLFIKDGGNVGIGTGSPGSYKLYVNGTAAKPGGGSWSNPSDGRLKEIKGIYKYGLSEVSQLKPVRYRYQEGNALGLPSDEEFVGLVAQEVQEIIPDAVKRDNNGYLMLNNDPVIWAMLNAIKELKAENEELKKRIESLENK